MDQGSLCTGVSINKLIEDVSFNPAQTGRSHKITFVVNWQHINKNGLDQTFMK